MHKIRPETSADSSEIERLTALGFDASHAKRNIWQLRHGEHLPELSLVAESESENELLGSIRYWAITIAGEDSLLLGPLAVNPSVRGQGIGKDLVRQSLKIAQQKGLWRWCFVSGEPDYYPRLGFESLKVSDIDLPAPIEEERLHLFTFSGHDSEESPPRPWIIRSTSSD